ncbi:MAG TPA: ATP synthase subunit I [Candidatus Acidoferrum sp.]|jgi:small-conductance mechanosensitive channel|nr:ATP synthase subunit I [Candidatus Acidoferrum sp.]
MADLQVQVSITSATQTERLIAWLTLFFGAVAGVAAALLHQPLWAGGLVVGAVLAWFNFRWLRQGIDALVAASQAQAGAMRPRVPIGAYFRVLFRYALIAVTVYVIFELLKFPLASMVVGLCALGPAAIAASVYEIARAPRVRK